MGFDTTQNGTCRDYAWKLRPDDHTVAAKAEASHDIATCYWWWSKEELVCAELPTIPRL